MPATYLVVGTGLIGTSIALGLRAAGHEVLLSDNDAEALDVAIAASGGRRWDGAEPADLVVVATPPRSVAAVIRHVAEVLPDAVITDVCSVKQPVLAAVDLVPSPHRVVGGHPMAGREIHGARAARSNLFVDRPWVVTRTPATSAAAIDAVLAMVATLGAVAVERSAAEHDRAVALVSHTPQAVASVLAGRLHEATTDDVALAGQGLRDTVRLAGSDSSMWTEILLANAEEVSVCLADVAQELGSLAAAVARGDEQHVAAVLRRGASGRDLLPGKHGSAPEAVMTLVVRVADRPGELARLFAVAADVGVNLEDVRIDHSMGRMTGLVELVVTDTAGERLAAALTASGFTVVG